MSKKSLESLVEHLQEVVLDHERRLQDLERKNK